MPFISDQSGRFATSYESDCVSVQKMKKEYNITDNYSYRIFLQQNASKLMEIERKKLSDKLALRKCNCASCLLTQ